MNKFLLLFSVFGLFFASAPASAEDVPVEDLLVEMKRALLIVEESAEEDALPPLKTATLNVSTVQKKVTGGKINLLIISFGKKKTSELKTDLSIVLGPPPKGSGSEVSSPQISQLIADAILAAGRAIKEAEKGSPALVAKEVTAKVKFGVSKDSEGGLKIEFAPVTVEGSGSSNSGNVHEIVLTYKVSDK